MLSPANFLILDEPTNHLDIQSKEILEHALKNYTGTVLCVSHDRYFINAISSRIIELKDNRLYSFTGNYDYYDSHKDIVYQAANAPTNTTVTSGFSAVTPGAFTVKAASNNKESYIRNKEEQARLRKRENDMKKLEAALATLEEKIAAIDEEINKPENATNSHKLSELAKEREDLDAELMSTYEKYYELEEE